MIDLKSYQKVVESVGDYVSTKNSTGNVLINDMLANMARHVHS
jgi:phosphate transport system protein